MNIDLLNNIYHKSLHENEHHISFWEKYLRDLNALDLKAYSEKLTVPVLVPIGNTVLFRGEVKHTNEVTVALGADYFAKCSLQQAEVIRQHRIKNAQAKLQLLKTEREYLENHLKFSKQNILEDSGHDIIEVFTEEEDKSWRKQHRVKVKQYKQRKDKSDEAPATELTDEELWHRLEELELQEELRNELSKTEKAEDVIHNKIIETPSNEVDVDYTDSDDGEDDDGDHDHNDNDVEVDDNDDEVDDNDSENDDDGNDVDENDDDGEGDQDCTSMNDGNTRKRELQQKNRLQIQRPEQDNKVTGTDIDKEESKSNRRSKLDLLYQAIERHSIVLDSLSSSKSRKKLRLKNEEDLVSRVNDMEELEELEDEIDRLEDIVNGLVDDEFSEADEDNSKQNKTKSVTFVDRNVCETLELTFKHSSVSPSMEPYNSKKGILKPSDIYEAYSKQIEHCSNVPSSILKKTNYSASTTDVKEKQKKKGTQKKVHIDDKQEQITNRTLVVKDVVEKVDHNDNNLNASDRPMSVFKKMRQQRKS